ncbi:hypothetical protein [Synechocystis sp. LKSZ1]|uniref:hypothetical protein n=1 Tax=Synechocystis sp. LKSZ1 TaxID=3144951 RepID=UPI00336C1BCC
MESAPSTFTLPDLTHPQELLQFGQQAWQISQWLLLFLLGLGVVLGWLNFSQRHHSEENRADGLTALLVNYSKIWHQVGHGLVLLAIVSFGFLLCSTLANRYHHWEQQQIQQTATTVTGERLEQVAPRLRYVIEEPYSTFVYIDGKATEVERLQQVNRFLSPSSAQIEVKINQVFDPASPRFIYQSALKAEYRVTNSLERRQDFVFEVPPPSGYTLLQDYRIEQQGRPLQPENQGEYHFPLALNADESATFQVSYQAQSASRWVYSSPQGPLSQFRLSILANFPNADFASGIVPSETTAEGMGTRFTWAFTDNVSVQNPFGVFTTTHNVQKTGILPRLLLLAPAIFLWWWALLYFSGPWELRDTLVSSAFFFAILLCLTYLSRLADARAVWGGLIFPVVGFAWLMGKRYQRVGSTLMVTLGGLIIPIAGCLIPYTGLSLSVAGLISVAALVIFPRRT